MTVIGKIKHLSGEGYGFVTPNEGQDVQEDVFFHQRSLVRGLHFGQLSKGDTLSMECTKGNKGWRADNTQRVAKVGSEN